MGQRGYYITYIEERAEELLVSAASGSTHALVIGSSRTHTADTAHSLPLHSGAMSHHYLPLSIRLTLASIGIVV